MIYYKVYDVLTWFEDDYIYLNFGKTTDKYLLITFRAQGPMKANRRISSFSQTITIYNIDIIKPSTLEQIEIIISSKQRELKINKILNDIL